MELSDDEHSQPGVVNDPEIITKEAESDDDARVEFGKQLNDDSAEGERSLYELDFLRFRFLTLVVVDETLFSASISTVTFLRSYTADRSNNIHVLSIWTIT